MAHPATRLLAALPAALLGALLMVLLRRRRPAPGRGSWQPLDG